MQSYIAQKDGNVPDLIVVNARFQTAEALVLLLPSPSQSLVVLHPHILCCISM